MAETVEGRVGRPYCSGRMAEPTHGFREEALLAKRLSRRESKSENSLSPVEDVNQKWAIEAASAQRESAAPVASSMLEVVTAAAIKQRVRILTGADATRNCFRVSRIIRFPME